MAIQRIDKILSAMGMASRREAAALAKSGAVAVDGVCCRDASKKIDPDTQKLTVRGQPVRYRTHVYLMMHKPLGVLSATKDREQQTVVDLLPEQLRAMDIFPVGRLDKDTSGLLLLTNDGAFAHHLTSPKHAVSKVYLAQTDGTPEQCDIDRFAQGLVLRDGTKCRPAQLEILAEGQVRVTVSEGRYHQVRRMLAACGTPVTQLKRLSEGRVALDERLRPGQWRELTEDEICLLSQ